VSKPDSVTANSAFCCFAFSYPFDSPVGFDYAPLYRRWPMVAQHGPSALIEDISRRRKRMVAQHGPSALIEDISRWRKPAIRTGYRD